MELKKQLTKDDKVKFFISETRRLQKELNLLSWEIEISELELETAKSETHWYNALKCESAGRITALVYDKEWIESNITKKEITKVVFHELIELLLSRLRDWSEQNIIYVSPREVDEEIHSIIRILENLFIGE